MGVWEVLAEFEIRDRQKATRYFIGLLLSVMVAFGLALAYVLAGIELLGNAEFLQIDSYAFTITFLIGVLIPIGHFMYFRDITEFVALLTTMMWALFGGLEDLFVYFLLLRFPPAELSWLDDSAVGIVARHVFGLDHVTGTFLIWWVLVTGLLGIGWVYVLYRIDVRLTEVV